MSGIGKDIPHAKRKAGGLRRVEVYVSPEASNALDALAERLGSNRAAVEWALVEATAPGATP